MAQNNFIGVMISIVNTPIGSPPENFLKSKYNIEDISISFEKHFCCPKIQF